MKTIKTGLSWNAFLLLFLSFAWGCTWTTSLKKGLRQLQTREPSSQEVLEPEQVLQKHLFTLRVLKDFENAPLSMVAVLVENLDDTPSENSKVSDFAKIEAAIFARFAGVPTEIDWSKLPSLSQENFQSIAVLAKRAHDIVDPEIRTWGWLGQSPQSFAQKGFQDGRLKGVLAFMDPALNWDMPLNIRIEFLVFAQHLFDELRSLTPALLKKFYNVSVSNPEKKIDFEKMIVAFLPKPEDDSLRGDSYFSQVKPESLGRRIYEIQLDRKSSDPQWTENSKNLFLKNAKLELPGAEAAFELIEPLRKDLLESQRKKNRNLPPADLKNDSVYLSSLSWDYFLRTQLASLKLDLVYQESGRFIEDLLRASSMISILNTRIEWIHELGGRYSDLGLRAGSKKERVLFDSAAENRVRNFQVKLFTEVLKNLWSSLAEFHNSTNFVYTPKTQVFVDDIAKISKNLLGESFLEGPGSDISIEHLASLNFALAELLATQTLALKKVSMASTGIENLATSFALFRTEISNQLGALEEGLWIAPGFAKGIGPSAGYTSKQNEEFKKRIDELRIVIASQSKDLEKKFLENQEKRDQILAQYKGESVEQLQNLRAQIAADRKETQESLDSQQAKNHTEFVEKISTMADALKSTRDEIRTNALGLPSEIRASVDTLKGEATDFLKNLKVETLEQEMSHQNSQYNRQMEDYLASVKAQEGQEQVDFLEKVLDCNQKLQGTLTLTEFEECFAYLKNRVNGNVLGVDFQTREVSLLNLAFESLKSPSRNLSFWSELGESWSLSQRGIVEGTPESQVNRFAKYRDLPNPFLFVEAARTLATLLRQNPKWAMTVHENTWNQIKGQVARYQEFSKELRQSESAPILTALNELAKSEADFVNELGQVLTKEPKIELREALKKLKKEQRKLFGKNIGEVSSLRAYAEAYAASLGLAYVTFPKSRLFDRFLSLYWGSQNRPGTDAWLEKNSKSLLDPEFRKSLLAQTELLKPYVEVLLRSSESEEFAPGLFETAQEIENSRLVVEKFKTEKTKVAQALTALRASSKTFLATASKR